MSAADASAQINVSETFKGTSAAGWSFGATSGSTTPYLTAGVVPGDTDGNGWLRLTESASNQATYALWDNAVFSVNAQIQIEMEYAFYDKGVSTMGGGDGMAFFLVDASESNFQAGAYGGSLGYAPLDANENNVWDVNDKSGMPGGYLGFGFDNWGNYGDSTEGRDGNFAAPAQGHQNTISVRGPDDGDGNNSTGWGLIESSSPLQNLVGGGQMDFPDQSTRPDQSGSGYRSFRLTLDANNQLLVEMKFDAAGEYIEAFTADLSAFDRPEYFKIGFTASTGGAYEIHEVRNVKVNMTPWQPDSFEWSDAAGGDSWAVGGNWVGGNVPSTNADILFGDAPTTGSSQPVQLDSDRQLNSITFDSPSNYSINGTNTITLGNTGVTGLPSINVNDYNGANARHKINVPLSLAENLRINNYSFSTLCINGNIATGGNSITTAGYGATNLNGVISGSGDLIVSGSSIPNTGAGIVTISGNNGSWTGETSVNGGQLVVLADNALGGLGAATNQAINQNSAAGNTTIRVTSTVAGNLSVGQEVFGAGIAPGSFITSISGTGGNRTVTLSKPLSSAVSSGNTFTFSTGHTTVNSGGTLTLRGGTNSAERLFISGTGTTLGRGELAGAIYNDGGSSELSGAVTLAANSTIRSRDGNLIISGNIGQAGTGRTLTKAGDGVLTLSGTNSYSGATVIEGGALRITASSALSSSSNLQLAGGVLEIAGDLNGGGTTGDYSQSLGTGGTNLQWAANADGGFSASGGDRTVRLNGNANNITWGATNFVDSGYALLLSSAYSDSTTTFANALSFNNGQREVRVADGSAAVDGVLSGILQGGDNNAGTGGLIKTGEGTLSLTGANTYRGATEVRGGALRVTSSSLPGGFDTSNTGNNFQAVQLAGGVLELNAGSASTFTRNLGALATEEAVRWADNKDGGFAASGADITVRLNNSTASITWGATNFVDSGSALVLGSSSANATLVWDKGLHLGNTTQTIRVIDGVSSFTGAEGRVSQAITNGSLDVTGNGRLDLTANNTYSGNTSIVGAEVRLRDSGKLASGTINISGGGTLTLDNTGTANESDRGSAAVKLDAGSLVLLGAAAGSSESLGALSLDGGASTIGVQRGGATASTSLAFTGSLVRDSSATVNFTTSGGALGGGAAGDPSITIGGLAADPATALGYATINGTDLASYTATGVKALAKDTTTAASGWTTAIHAAPSSDGSATLSGNVTVGSLVLSGGRTVSGSFDLGVASGGILSFGASANTISTSTLHAGSGASNLYTHVYGTGGLTISSSITNDGATAKGLVKTGDGSLTLSGATGNTFTGATTVQSGTLVLNKSAGAVAIVGDGSVLNNETVHDLVIGDGRGTDTVRLLSSEQIGDTASVLLSGGSLFNDANQAVFDLNGQTETFHTLQVEGNSVLDFGGGDPCTPTFLFLDVLGVADDALLTIGNWIEFTDFLLVDKTTFDSSDLGRVVFDGYGGSASWKDYDSNFFQIVPYSPVPEPGSYGALLFGGILGLRLTRRRRRA